jgi:tetratricopeptide (TPR) repeat protein
MKRPALLLAFALAAPSVQLHAQGGNPPSPRALAQREASRLDGEGQHAEARSIWQRLIDEAPDAAAKAAAQRRMAMSHGFEGHCAVTVRYHQMVIDYWKTREAEEPQNAFYQQGEMANESARGCIDAGDLDTAERMYRLGYELGNKEPEPRTHPRSLWEYRMAHALGRLAARRGNKAEAERQVAEARRILDADSVMAEAQERFYPYLVGYVALYTGDLAKAEATLSEALAVRGNQNDPFLHALLGRAH